MALPCVRRIVWPAKEKPVLGKKSPAQSLRQDFSNRTDIMQRRRRELAIGTGKNAARKDRIDTVGAANERPSPWRSGRLPA
jgi:hypothetical protein